MKFQCPQNVKWPVYLLFILFGTGSWIAVNGLWVELPILVNEAPEGWNLPSYFVILIQIANIGPLLYTVINRFAPRHFNEKHGIVIIVVIGAAACLMLVFLWDQTAFVAGAERSVGLFVCVFLLSLVDCTSSVVFLSFMAFFKIQYVSAMFIGNGMSGFLPGVVALIQNVGQTNCVTRIVNSTTNETAVFGEYVQPNFPVENFFYLLFAIMLMCGLCFLLLQYSPYCKTEHTSNDNLYDVQANWSKSKLDFTKSKESDVSTITEHSKSFEAYSNAEYKPEVDDEATIVGKDTEERVTDRQKPMEDETKSVASSDSFQDKREALTMKDYVVLLFVVALINGLKNGVVPSISSYSTLPYGNFIYLLAATLMSALDPFACVVAFFLPVYSLRGITGLTVVGCGLATYIVVIAAYSPVPPMVDQTIGAVLIVAATALFAGVTDYLNTCVATIFRKESHKALILCGVFTQVGSFIFALIMFILVNIEELFQAKYACT